MECRCLQVEARERRELIVGQDWRMWRRSSLARSVICIIAKRWAVKRADLIFVRISDLTCYLFVLSTPD